MSKRETRRQRRAEAKRFGLDFKPKYNGQGPLTHLQAKGVGYERFDTKYNVVSTKTNSPGVE